jgi:hypothetical protein
VNFEEQEDKAIELFLASMQKYFLDHQVSASIGDITITEIRVTHLEKPLTLAELTDLYGQFSETQMDSLLASKINVSKDEKIT